MLLAPDMAGGAGVPSARPNGVRVSSGARKKKSFPNLRAPTAHALVRPPYPAMSRLPHGISQCEHCPNECRKWYQRDSEKDQSGQSPENGSLAGRLR